jgi:hypothetical protein
MSAAPVVIETVFPVGQLVITPGAADAFKPSEVFPALADHCSGETWGDTPPEDKETNARALAYGGRLLSTYTREADGARLWIITEADRSATTVLLPDEY